MTLVIFIVLLDIEKKLTSGQTPGKFGVIVQSTVVTGRPVMGLIPWTSNCRLFQSNDYGTRRQSRPPNQAHAGCPPQSRHHSLKAYNLAETIWFYTIQCGIPPEMRLINAARQTIVDAVKTSLELFKIMVPIIILVKILKELGLIGYLAVPLTPFMELVGLPAKTGLVWATALANNLYSAIIVYVALIPEMPPLSVAQVTVMCTMMLIAHNLPVEARITQKCGVTFGGQVLIRLLGALACGVLLNLVFTHFDVLQEPATVIWRAKAEADTIPAWALGQARNLGAIFCIIFLVMAVMRLLNYLRITDLFSKLLEPVLRFMGIGREAATITIIGLTMGIAYGGGLIIHEAQKGNLSKNDVFAAVSLMGLSHALIEDSLLMVLVGASTYGIFWGRLLFSLLAVAFLTRYVVGKINGGSVFWRKVFLG